MEMSTFLSMDHLFKVGGSHKNVKPFNNEPIHLCFVQSLFCYFLKIHSVIFFFARISVNILSTQGINRKPRASNSCLHLTLPRHSALGISPKDVGWTQVSCGHRVDLIGHNLKEKQEVTFIVYTNMSTNNIISMIFKKFFRLLQFLH